MDRDEHQVERALPQVEATVETSTAETSAEVLTRLERRRMIKAAIAAMPIVLTITAGKARAQDASVADSQETSPDPQEEGDGLEEDADGAQQNSESTDEERDPLQESVDNMKVWGLENDGPAPTQDDLRF